MSESLLLHLSFALGGGLGAVSRHMMTLLVTHRFPLSTLIVNFAGCLILGFMFTLLGDIHGFAGEEKRRLAFGFCGGLTTFSSFAYQTLDLYRENTIIHAAGNILLNLLFCLIAFWGGRWVCQWFSAL